MRGMKKTTVMMPVSLAWFAEDVLGYSMDPVLLDAVAELEQTLELTSGETLTTKLTSGGVLSMALGKKTLLKISKLNCLQARTLINIIFEVIAEQLKGGEL